MNTHQYFCKKCGYEREGQLDHPAGIGGYSWACPQCKSHDIDSREVIMTKKVTDERLADMIRQCTDADNQPESLLWDEDVLVCLHELQRLRAIEPLKHQGYDGQMHSGIRSDCARCSIEPPVTNERTELLECLDQLAKHIRAGETLNQNNAASIVEDAAAALRAHEPKAPQSPRFTYKDWLDRDCCYNCKRPITSCFCNGSPLNRTEKPE